MKKIVKWFQNHLPTKRRLIQLYAALLFNANLKGFGNGRIYQGPLKNICTPGLNCYSCPGASGACPIGALQNALSASKTRAPTYVLGIILLYGILFGRWICGFLCPFGLIQELLHKIKTPKLKKGRVTRILSYFKYVILVVFVFIFPLLYMVKDFPLPGFCKYICPAGTLEGAFGLLSNAVNESSLRMLGPIFTWKFILLVSFVVGAVFIYRIFCRFICPLGALYGLFNKISLVGIKLERSKCIDCGKCVSHCKMDIHHVGDAECISCGECIGVCPTKAIRFKGGKAMLAPNEIEGVSEEEAKKIADTHNEKVKKRNHLLQLVAVVLMIAVLASALIYYNVVDQAPGTPATPEVTTPAPNGQTPPAELGWEVGKLCYPMNITLLDGEDTVYNISEREGKITIINFWYVSCSACVAEMPEINQIATEYGDAVEVIAIHSDNGEDAKGYVDKNWSTYNALFGFDANDDYYYLLGGSGAWPMTLVLDENDIVVAHYPGSITYEELKADVESILAKNNQ